MSTSAYKIENVKDFNTEHIFECGQCFRWNRLQDGSYDMAAMGRKVNVRCEDGTLTIDPCTKEEYENIWKHYFDLDTDYTRIKEMLCRDDEVMRRAADFGWGIRILRQDLWETIVDFIISQNNNIPRIKGCIERLCCLFGEPIRDITDTDPFSRSEEETLSGNVHKDNLQKNMFSGESVGENDILKSKNGELLPLSYDIPRPEVLAALSEEDLAPVRLGYRAGYLVKSSREILERGMPSGREELLALTGVGPKVASCVELFGMGHMYSFPIDVWVRRLMHELYGLDEKNKKAMAEYAARKFGQYGGIAQQYLFYYERENS